MLACKKLCAEFFLHRASFLLFVRFFGFICYNTIKQQENAMYTTNTPMVLFVVFCKMKRRNANKRGNERKQENHGNDIKMVRFKI